MHNENEVNDSQTNETQEKNDTTFVSQDINTKQAMTEEEEIEFGRESLIERFPDLKNKLMFERMNQTHVFFKRMDSNSIHSVQRPIKDSAMKSGDSLKKRAMTETEEIIFGRDALVEQYSHLKNNLMFSKIDKTHVYYQSVDTNTLYLTERKFECYIEEHENNENESELLIKNNDAKTESNATIGFLGGFFAVVLFHCIWIVFPTAVFFIGVAQLVYVVPLIIKCRKNKPMLSGIGVAAGITFLLNSACWGMLMGTNF